MVSTRLVSVTHVNLRLEARCLDEDRFSKNDAIAANVAAVGVTRGENLFFRSFDDREDGNAQT